MGESSGQLKYDFGKCSVRYSWTVEKFSRYINEVHVSYLQSPTFSTLHSDYAKQWRIKFMPRNFSRRNLSDFAAIFLEYLGDSEVACSLTFYISGVSSHVPRNLGVQLKCRFSPQDKSYGFENMFKPSECKIEHHAPLTILCDIHYDLPYGIAQIVDNPINNTVLEKSHSEDNLLDDLDKLFETELLGDVTVNIGQEKKYLHKALLASRSEVFRAMFQHNMMEKEQNIVDVVDIRLEVAVEMFRYLYTGKVKNIEELSVDEFLMAAEKYAITGLKTMCENIICKDLNVDNALHYLKLAIMYNSIDLKTNIMAFVVKYLDKFVDKTEFKSLDPSILCDLFSTVVIKKY